MLPTDPTAGFLGVQTTVLSELDSGRGLRAVDHLGLLVEVQRGGRVFFRRQSVGFGAGLFCGRVGFFEVAHLVSSGEGSIEFVV